MESDSDNKQIDINGVTDIIRIEGQIGGIDKVYYLYIIYNEHVSSQLQCDNIFSVDIEKHFADTIISLQNNDKMYDFYIENINSFYVSQNTIDRKQQYSDEVKKFFFKIFDDYKRLYSLSTIFKNIRCNYLDTKEFYLKNDITNYNSCVGLFIQDILYFDYNVDTLNSLVNCLSNLKNKLNDLFLGKILSNDKMFDKLQYKYTNSEVKNVGIFLINDFFDLCKQCVVDIDSEIKTIIEFTALFDSLFDDTQLRFNDKNGHGYGIDTKTIDKYCNQIFTNADKLSHNLSDIETILEVAVLNRQFNDNNCSNIIIVANYILIFKYIEIMVKKYKFKVTHSSSSNSDYSILNKNLTNSNIVEYSKYLLPEVFSQCTNVINLPGKFN